MSFLIMLRSFADACLQLKFGGFRLHIVRGFYKTQEKHNVKNYNDIMPVKVQIRGYRVKPVLAITCVKQPPDFNGHYFVMSQMFILIVN